MKMTKLKIKKEFIEGGDVSLELLSYMLNRDNGVQIKRITNYETYIDYICKNDKSLFPLFEEYKKGKLEHSLESTDIDDLIKDSIYKPFSFHFIKDLFWKMFKNSMALENFKFQRGGRKGGAWLYRKPLISFLKYFTNIDDVAVQFVKEMKKLKGVKFVEDYGDAQYYQLVYMYIKKDKKLFDEIKDINLLSVDNKFLIAQKWKLMKHLSYRTMIYYASSFKEGSALFS